MSAVLTISLHAALYNLPNRSTAYCMLKGKPLASLPCRYAMAQLMRMPACCYVEADYRMVVKRRKCESRAT